MTATTAPPIREVLRNQRTARVLLGEVVHIDLGAREVVLQTISEHTRIPYTLVTGLDRSGLDIRLSGDTSQRPFRYRDLGTMATIARFRAVVFIGRVHLTGFAAWLMWLLVHLAFLTGFKNRLAAVAFLGYDRRQRTITEQQVFARTREVKQPEATGPDRALLKRPSGRGCR